MTKYSVRTTRGPRVMTRVTPAGNRFVFFKDDVVGPRWVHLNTDANPLHKQDIEFFESDDLFEVVEGWPADGTPKPEPTVLEIVSEVAEKVSEKVSKPKKAWR